MPDISKLLQPSSITAITVKGYKSLSQAQRIEIRPLTILAGANSSGKSSIMQPVLLLKQTLEASYDPGTLLLDGPYVHITSVDQVLSKNSHEISAQQFSIECEIDDPDIILDESKAAKIGVTFKKSPKKGFDIQHMSYQEDNGEIITLYPEMSHEEIINIIPPIVQKMYDTWFNVQPLLQKNHFHWTVKYYRCFLSFAMLSEKDSQILSPSPHIFTYHLTRHLQNMIYLSGLRGNPERTYRTSAIGEEFPGDFKNYVASLVFHWQQTHDDKLTIVNNALQELALTWKVEASPIDDTRVELRVGRFSPEESVDKDDMVSIADVGFGVSQALPVIVALTTALPGQIVYLEQPEIHLHPNAQHKLAKILVNAAKRGVQIIVETHSSLLLTGIQTLVAAGELPPELIKLHWFTRTSGITEIDSTDVDETGAFGEWPQDFDDVTLRAENAYLSAVEQREYITR